MARLCGAEGCTRIHSEHGYCHMHYERIKRTGTLETPQRPSPGERFWAKVDKSAGPESCWEWLAHRNRTGYGKFKVRHDKPPALAHRHSYELTSGQPVPNELSVRHSCDNPGCVNPAHLSLGTHQDNMRDAVERGRTHKSTPRAECRSGHAMTPDNTLTYMRGGYVRRECRACNRDKARRRYAEKKASLYRPEES